MNSIIRSAFSYILCIPSQGENDGLCEIDWGKLKVFMELSEAVSRGVLTKSFEEIIVR